MTPLGKKLRERIARCGPIPVAEFMAAANGDPQFGYYARRDPLGREGDFVTAPEIGQVFGELIGAWCVDTWHKMGSPGRAVLVELGPGRGTLMADLLRATKGVSGFREALDIHLVETSPALVRLQGAALGETPASWHRTFSTVPDGPLLLIANEFFDALPVEQYVARGGLWHRRAVDLDGAGFRFVDGPAVPDPPWAVGICAEEGEIRERNPETLAALREIARRLAASRGAALIVDYGYVSPGPGETLQAVAGHRYADPLAAPGEADLSAHVDFAACATAARAAGAIARGPETQGRFLDRLGIAVRTDRLIEAAAPEQRASIRAARRRLTGGEAMGELFKALALTDPGMPAPAGFESSRR